MSEYPEIYVSTDVETDGPCPGIHSMLSFASVVFSPNGEELGAFSQNLELIPGSRYHEDTMNWWAKQPHAWEACRKGRVSPETAMFAYVDWVKSMPGNPVFVAYPAGFDFSFVYYYLMRFVGESPFSFSALDMKTYAMALLGTPFRKMTKKAMPSKWFKDLPPHTHLAEDDAREQGLLFMAMLKESRARRFGGVADAIMER